MIRSLKKLRTIYGGNKVTAVKIVYEKRPHREYIATSLVLAELRLTLI